MDFWETIKTAFENSGWDNQGDFAEEYLGIDGSTFSRYMSGGQPSFDNLKQIAEKLGLELLVEPNETNKRVRKQCTESDLRDCLERMRNLDSTDVSYVLLMVRSILEEKQKRGKPKREVV